MNFATVRAKLGDVFARIAADESQPNTRPIYLASIDLHDFFTGLAEANTVELGDRAPLAGIWMGTRTRIAAHNDVPDNLACVAVGRRRFTLFPREQFPNLYLGPVDNTPRGARSAWSISTRPIWLRHPRFARRAGACAGRRSRTGRCVVHTVDVVAPCRGARARSTSCSTTGGAIPRASSAQPQDALNHAHSCDSRPSGRT